MAYFTLDDVTNFEVETVNKVGSQIGLIIEKELTNLDKIKLCISLMYLYSKNKYKKYNLYYLKFIINIIELIIKRYLTKIRSRIARGLNLLLTQS